MEKGTIQIDGVEPNGWMVEIGFGNSVFCGVITMVSWFYTTAYTMKTRLILDWVSSKLYQVYTPY